MLRVTFPKCAYCGFDEVFSCPVCERFVCRDCTIGISRNRCEHKKYEKPKYPTWEVEWSR